MEKATKVRLTIAGALLAGTMALSAGQASAMPALDHGLANAQGAQTEQVRWVCNPWGRCWWRPNYYGGYGFYRPRPWGYGYGGWGWRRRWW
ncbi:MAG: hypothetical protein JOZ16_09655 [Methylobacteriaceae bacterium]|nr:hypothetical protein [Methylobacteriaceae bacterium]